MDLVNQIQTMGTFTCHLQRKPIVRNSRRIELFWENFQLVNIICTSNSDLCIRYGNNFSSWWTTQNMAPCVRGTWENYFRTVESLSRTYSFVHGELQGTFQQCAKHHVLHSSGHH